MKFQKKKALRITVAASGAGQEIPLKISSARDAVRN